MVWCDMSMYSKLGDLLVYDTKIGRLTLRSLKETLVFLKG